METKSLSLREFNKKISKKRANLNMEKLYQIDNYLVQTLKRTKRITFEKPIEKFEINLEKILKKIYKKIKLLNDPKIEEINKENNIFKSDYFIILKNFQNSTSKTFQDLINIYKNKGYKIPSFNYDHNLFKVNPLIEENTNKIIHYFLTQEKVTNKKEILLIKSLVFLNKLNKLIMKALNKNKKNERRKSMGLLSYQEESDKSENIEILKKNIEEILTLIKNITNSEKNNISKYNTINNNSIVKTRRASSKNETDIKYFSSRNLQNSLKNSLTNKFENNRKSLRLNTQGVNFYTKFEQSYLLNKNSESIINTQREKSNKEIKKLKNILTNTSSNKKIQNKSGKSINNTKIIKHLNSEKKIEISKQLNNVNININKRNKFLNSNLHKNQISKTLTRLKRKTRKEIESEPLFIRTQTSEKRTMNIYNLVNKKKLEIKSRNLSFLNKNEFLNDTYKRLKRGDYNNIDKYLKKYLNEIECKNNEETNLILSEYDYKNFNFNLLDLQNFIRKSELDRKIEKIYLNNFLSKRITDSLETMREKEKQIYNFSKIVTILGNSK